MAPAQKAVRLQTRGSGVVDLQTQYDPRPHVGLTYARQIHAPGMAITALMLA